MDSIVLYRGDYSDIDEFAFHKTNKHCLFGQGVYLTTSVAVANSYRSKGADWRDPETLNLHGIVTLFSGTADNREVAYDKAFRQYCEKGIVQEAIPQNITKKNREQYLRFQFRDLIDSKQITAEYTSFSFEIRRGAPKTIKVEWDTNRWLGHLSRFSFPKRQFEISMLNVDKPIMDNGLLELFWDEGIADSIMTPYATKEGYVSGNFRNRIAGIRKSSWSSLRNVVEPYGYRGLEYNGGHRIGGFGSHRAFCVWDDTWVNQHRVSN